jgi:hypothetical protein
MKFIRVFKSGGEDYDARQHKIAEWKCDVCKYVHWDDHVDERFLDKYAEKKCPKCGSYSKEDRIHALKLRQTELDKEQIKIQKERVNIQIEIEKMCSEQTPVGSK